MSHAALVDRLHRRIGLDPESIGQTALWHGIDEACAAMGMRDSAELLSRVDRSDVDWQQFVDRMVVPETWFFRVPEQFADMLRFVRSELAERRPLRILSLPCATGEEAYSIAATLVDAGFASSSFEVLGVDVSERAVALAREARYRNNSLRGRSLDANWFHNNDGVISPAPTISRSVRFRVGNILAPGVFAAGERFDLIFCRNLLIYLDIDARKQTLDTLIGVLEPGGLMLAGQAEVLSSIDRRLQPLAGYGPLSFVLAKPAPPQEAALPVATRRVAPPGPVLTATRITRTPGTRPVQSSVDEMLELARKAADSGRLDAARADCTAVLARAPESAAAWYLLGMIEMASGALEAADQAFIRASYLDRNHHDALQHRAALAERLGRPSEAAQLRSRLQRQVRQADGK